MTQPAIGPTCGAPATITVIFGDARQDYVITCIGGEQHLGNHYRVGWIPGVKLEWGPEGIHDTTTDTTVTI